MPSDKHKRTEKHWGNCANPYCGKKLTERGRHPTTLLLSFVLHEVIKKDTGERMAAPAITLHGRRYLCHECFTMFEVTKPPEEDKDEHRTETEEPQSTE